MVLSSFRFSPSAWLWAESEWPPNQAHPCGISPCLLRHPFGEEGGKFGICHVLIVFHTSGWWHVAPRCLLFQAGTRRVTLNTQGLLPFDLPSCRHARRYQLMDVLSRAQLWFPVGCGDDIPLQWQILLSHKNSRPTCIHCPPHGLSQRQKENTHRPNSNMTPE